MMDLGSDFNELRTDLLNVNRQTVLLLQMEFECVKNEARNKV